jgi:hypothetical protein
MKFRVEVICVNEDGAEQRRDVIRSDGRTAVAGWPHDGGD